MTVDGDEIGFSTQDLGTALERERRKRRLSLGAVAKETGLSKSTLSRTERGVGTPDADTVVRITNWLKIPVNRVMKGENEPVIYYPNEATPAIVRAHLQADKSLTPKVAAALAELFDVAYAQFSKK
jgi:transcriptional regulator with XRE-family HTH domain